MQAIDEIVDAARKLKPEQLRRLRKRLDAIEERVWDKELERRQRGCALLASPTQTSVRDKEKQT